jgi:hypothetical protein
MGAQRPLGSAADARDAGSVVLRFSDGALPAIIDTPDPPHPRSEREDLIR